jgi:ATP-binding cassette, subfamily B, bacterial HlyB/CyaB
MESCDFMAEEIKDTGLFSLMLILRFFDSAVNPQQIRTCCGSGLIGIPEMAKAANRLGFKTRVARPKWARLSKATLPGIVALRNGRFLILGKLAEDRVLIQHPGESRPEVISRAQFESLWDGRVVLFARRGKLSRAVRSGVGRITGLPARCARHFSELSDSVAKLAARSGNWVAGKLATQSKLRGLISGACNSIIRVFAGGQDGPDGDNVESATIAHSDGSGLEALVLLLRIHNIASDAEQIRHRCATPNVGVNEMLRCAKEFGQYSLAWYCGASGWRICHPRQSCRRQGACSISVIITARGALP